MIIECTNCRAKYQYDEDRFERKPSKKIRCAKCQTVFEIHNPAFAPRRGAGLNDSTSMRRGEATRTKPPQDTTAQSPLPTDEPDQKSTGELGTDYKLPEGKRLSLAIINGPDAGNVFRIDKPVITIGRSGADLTLNDSEASRNHAAVEVRETTFIVKDLGSTNGTLMNGSKIEGSVEIQNHSEFQVGSTTLMLIVTDDV